MKLFALSIIFSTYAFAQTTTLSLTVQSYSGNGPANLVSNAIPFKPGALTDPQNFRILDGTQEVSLASRVLATWPSDNSIRSVLVQFIAPTAKSYTLEIGARRSSPDASLIPVTWDLPQRIFTLPASYLSDSLIVWEQKPLGQSGFPAWETKQTSNYNRIATVGTAPCVRDDQYYDSIGTTYQMYARTGNLQYLVNARRWALHHRRDQIYLSGSNIGHPICSGGYLNNTRYTFPQSLVTDYFMFGDDEARRVAGIVVDNFYMPHASSWYYKAPNTRGFWTEREPAFSLMGILGYYEATNNPTYLNTVRDRVASLHRMQTENGRRAWVHNLYDHDPSEGCSTTEWGSSPFMSGLLLEAVIKYHKLTGDPIARESILMAVDDLRARDLATGSYAGNAFRYLGCAIYRDGSPDIDNLITHAYGYAYKLTGDNTYRQLGTNVFNTSVANGYAGAHKQFNQQFRSSGHFVAYIAAPATTDTTPPTVSITSPTAGQILSGSFTATASASDNIGVTGVQFLIDGAPYGAEDTASPYSVAINATALSNGSHTLAARARDAAGNTRTSTAVSFNVAGDTTLPTVSITSPTAGQTLSGSFTATASASDNIGVTGVQFLIDGAPYGAEDTASPYSVSVNSTALSNGAHTIAARARDAAGNTRTSTAVSFNVSNSTLPPSTSIRVNAGGGAYTDPQGLAWLADTGFDTGTTFATTAPIANTTADPMYQTQRVSSTPLTYTFNVPNGAYTVYLKVAELSATAARQRLFDIEINGVRVVSRLDVYAVARGRNIALNGSFRTSVVDGRIRVTFRPVVGSAIINAIEIGQ